MTAGPSQPDTSSAMPMSGQPWILFPRQRQQRGERGAPRRQHAQFLHPHLLDASGLDDLPVHMVGRGLGARHQCSRQCHGVLDPIGSGSRHGPGGTPCSPCLHPRQRTWSLREGLDRNSSAYQVQNDNAVICSGPFWNNGSRHPQTLQHHDGRDASDAQAFPAPSGSYGRLSAAQGLFPESRLRRSLDVRR